MTRKIKTIKIKVDADTGEELSSTVYTQEQVEGYKKMLGAAAEYDARGYFLRKQSDDLGGFTWLIYNTGEILDLGLEPDALTKIIYLSTFMDYDNYLTTGNLTREKERITRVEAAVLLGIGERKFYEFWKSVKAVGVLIEEPEEGYIKLNDEIFHRGSLEGVEVSKRAIRIYANAVRKLYEKSTAREHKLLSKVFQAIPYINIKYNILCTNPDETELKFVKCLCLTDYCRFIGYDINNVPQLRKALKRLTVMNEGVFGFTETCAGDSIFVNPMVYYGGNNYDEVKVLGKFFEEGDSNL